MGRMILCPHCQSTMNEDILKQKNSENVCLVCGKPLDDSGDDGHSDWITWYYYGFKSDNGESATLRDKPIDLEKFGDTYFLIKEFKAPPRDSSGSSEKAKEILRTYVPNAFSESKNTSASVCCPRCGCSEFTLLNRGYSLLTGFLGSGRVKRVCNRCKKEF
ncbi:hypothetical protein D7X88_17940 [bacterium C-53]|nr:hypothetical protein [Lachnospiraceae bacterium]NBI04825.1 hypothetical protein [Lachnospiraceae bacterium]RKJ07734.1 hypothetical protein D7X88_17940 [bacterium C-53]